MSSSSLFASLGAALHTLSSPRFSFRASSPAFKSNADLTAFESELASRLEQLKLTNEADYLTASWLYEAMEVVLLAYSSAEAFIPDLRQALGGGDVKWLDDYLDNSINLLDICATLKEAISEIKNYHTHVTLALRALEKGAIGEPQLRRCRKALVNCIETFKRKDDAVNHLGSRRSKLENCSSMLRRMGERLNTDDASKGNFFMVIYAAQVTTIFSCGLLSSALSFKPRRPLSTINVGGQSPWSILFSSLQQKVKEQIEKKKSKGATALVLELDKIDNAVQTLHRRVEQLLQPNFFPLKETQASEIKESIKVLSACSDELHQWLSLLEARLEDVYKILLTSRMTLLDLYSHS